MYEPTFHHASRFPCTHGTWNDSNEIRGRGHTQVHSHFSNMEIESILHQCSSVSRSRRNLRSFLLLLPANKSRYDRIPPAVVGQERKVYKAGVGISEGSILLLLLCSSERGRAAITVYYDVIHDAGRDNNRRMAFEALERCSVRLATRGGGGERTPLAWPRTRYRRCSSA